MRTTIIPAQITTVEDTIAENLNFTQMLLLMLALFVSGVIYVLFPAAMHLSTYKVVCMIAWSLLCCIFALRIKGKLVLEWATLIATYHQRPAYYVFDKNDTTGRDMDLPIVGHQKAIQKKKLVLEVQNPFIPTTDVAQLVTVEQLMGKRSVSFKTDKKGGFHVALE